MKLKKIDLARFLKKKPNKGEGQERPLSTTYFIEQIGDSKRSFVFGLNWFVILGESLDKEAYKLARRRGADFYVRGGSQSNTVGLLRTNKENGYPQRGQDTHAASLIFARAMPNGAFVVRFNTPKGVWLMAANKGVVQEGSDCFFSDYEQTDTLITHLKTRWPELQVFGDAEGDSDIPDLSLLLSKINDSSKIRRAMITLQSIPKWVWLLVIAGAGYMGYQEVVTRLDDYKRAQIALAQRIELKDPAREWKKVIDNWSRKTQVLGENGLASWTHALVGIPSFIGKWELNNLQCSGVGKCKANYTRMRLGTLASFEQYVPNGWEYSLSGLDKMSTSFTLPISLEPIATLGLNALPDARASQQDKINRLQRIMPVISSVDSKEAVKVALTAPKQERADGSFTPIAFPENATGLVYPYTSVFSFTMPLRSLPSIGLADNYAINSIDITRSEGGSSGNSSWFTLTIKGEYYVQK